MAPGLQAEPVLHAGKALYRLLPAAVILKEGQVIADLFICSQLTYCVYLIGGKRKIIRKSSHLVVSKEFPAVIKGSVYLHDNKGRLLAFPGLVFALAIAAVLGGGVMNAVIALAAISWPKYARIARGLTLAQKNEPYLKATRLAGCGTAQLVFKHILPNIAGPLLVTAMLDIGTMMMELAGLSFLGLGAQPPMAEWGSMMSDNRNLLQTAPWTVIAPGLAIFVTVMIFNLLGDTVRDFMDPSHRKTLPGGQGWLRSMRRNRVNGELPHRGGADLSENLVDGEDSSAGFKIGNEKGRNHEGD